MEKPHIPHNIIKNIAKKEGFHKADEVGYDLENLENDEEVDGSRSEDEYGEAETFEDIAKKEEIKDLIYNVDKNSSLMQVQASRHNCPKHLILLYLRHFFYVIPVKTGIQG